MRKLLAVAFAVLVAALLPAHAQLSKSVGVYDSSAYHAWGAAIAVGNSSTGSQTITVCPGPQALPDGRIFNPFVAANGVWSPITVDTGSGNAEVVTPTATATVAAPTGYPASSLCETVTASFSNTHGQSLNPQQVTSGDQGVQEAINDASVNGGGMVFWRIDPGIVTLATGSQTTNLGSVNIPTRSVVMQATARVTTTITACGGGWGLGFSSSDELASTNTTLTAGTTTDSSTIKTPYAFTASAAVPIAYCTTAAASAGAIHATFSGYKVAAPAS